MYHFNVYLAFSCILGVCSACYTRRRLCIFWCVSLLYIYIYIYYKAVCGLRVIACTCTSTQFTDVLPLHHSGIVSIVLCIHILFELAPPPRPDGAPRDDRRV